MKAYRYFDFLMALFVTVLLLSNLLSSAKIVDLGVTIGALRLSFDAGTLVFPISYIFGDVLTEVYGYKYSRRVIWVGFLASALMGGFVWLVGVLPGESEWSNRVGQSAYDLVLGSMSGLVVASVLAYLAGEFCNSYVLAKMKILTGGRWLWMRTIGSTLIGQLLDTFIFFVVAAFLGVFPVTLLPSLMVTNYLFKVGIEVILTPVTLVIVQALKHVENEDHYDYDTRFTPFTLDL
jgi:uncharacterized integral membrane protein (TIGR00697 family)